MNINYIAMSDIPSKNANSLQIVQMCNAFSLLGHKVNLIIPNLGKSNKSLRQFYGIESKFRVFEVYKEVSTVKLMQRGTLHYKVDNSIRFTVLSA